MRFKLFGQYLIMFLILACERPSREVESVDPCSDKSKKDSSGCVRKSPGENSLATEGRRTSSSGPTEDVGSSWEDFDRSSDSDSFSAPDSFDVTRSLRSACSAQGHTDERTQCSCRGSISSLRYALYQNSTTALTDFRRDLANECLSSGGGRWDGSTRPGSIGADWQSPFSTPNIPSVNQPLNRPGGSPFLPNTPGIVQNIPIGSGVDRTSAAGLMMQISPEGSPILVFRLNNASRFSSMEYSLERTNLQAQPSSLALQGQPNILGEISLSMVLNFMFEGSQCTGTGVGRFSEQTNISVRCR